MALKELRLSREAGLYITRGREASWSSSSSSSSFLGPRGRAARHARICSAGASPFPLCLRKGPMNLLRIPCDRRVQAEPLSPYPFLLLLGAALLGSGAAHRPREAALQVRAVAARRLQWHMECS